MFANKGPAIRCVALIMVLSVVAAGADPAPAVSLGAALTRLYNSDFSGASKILDSWIGQHPTDPVGHALKAAAYMFTEFNRLQILEGEFFENDKQIIEKKRLKYDPATRDNFYREIDISRKLATAALAKDPKDEDALFSMTISGGLLTDYTSLIERKNITSLGYAKEAQGFALRLLAIDPNYGDAYLTTGFSEYLVGSLPFFVKWFTHFDNTQGNKTVAIDKLERVANTGRYLGPFARIFLAIIYLREKQPVKSEALLTQLSQQYPENPLMKTELGKVRAVLAHGTR